MTGTLVDLVIAAAAFVGSHFLFSSQPIRGILVGGLGEGLFSLLYSLLSAILLTWCIFAYRDAPYVEYWPTLAGARYLASAVMIFSAVLLVCGFTSYNPTAIGIPRLVQPSDPTAGILRVTRHPVMWAIGLWGIVHMIANGDAASLIFFGAFAVLALGGTVALDRKKRTTMAPTTWEALMRGTSNVPFVALVQGRARVSLSEIGYWRIGLGLLAYAGFLLGHGSIIGVSAIAG